MPRYFLDLHTSRGVRRDRNGQVFPDLDTARTAARVRARGAITAALADGAAAIDGHVAVRGEDATISDHIPFRATVADGKPVSEAPQRGPTRIGEALLSHLLQFGPLEPEEQAAIARVSGTPRSIARGEDIVPIGVRPQFVVVALSGLLQRYTIAPQGGRQIHAFYIPTDAPCLEELNLERMDNTLAAAAPAEIGIVPHDTMFALMNAYPRIQSLIWRVTLVRASMMREWLTRNSRMLAPMQMAHFFCEMATRMMNAGIGTRDSVSLPITQETLGDALGMTPVHVNRTLMILRATGAVEWRGGMLRIHDWNMLREIAEFDPAYLHLRPPQRKEALLANCG